MNGTGALGCDVPAAAVHVCPPDQGAGDGARRRVQKVQSEVQYCYGSGFPFVLYLTIIFKKDEKRTNIFEI